MPAPLAKILGSEIEGIDGRIVSVEVDMNVGLHSFSIVGLGDRSLNEAKERVNSAIKNSGFRPPNRENKKITVNLAPADLEKSGSQYDLPIAIGYLVSSEQIKRFDSEKVLIAGELGLDGSVRSIRGALNIALAARETGISSVILPKENAPEAAIIPDIAVFGVKNLIEAVDHLSGIALLSPVKKPDLQEDEIGGLMEDIRGQAAAKRALMIAAAGGHNLLMVGPPGSGKTVLARSLSSIMPSLSLEESIEVSRTWSAAGALNPDHPFMLARPFRDPHHSASVPSLVGGGSHPKPGEISLAHHGVLFLDELPEFRKDALEALRQPIESGRISIGRIKGSISFPARFQLIAAMNPCPCGFHGDPDTRCSCSSYDVIRYQKKISGPLLDRIDIQIRVPRIKISELKSQSETESSRSIRSRVEKAAEIAKERLRNLGIFASSNTEMSSKDCERGANLSEDADDFLKKAFERYNLSTRSYYRIIKVARTIADLDGEETVKSNAVAEALQYRTRNDS